MADQAEKFAMWIVGLIILVVIAILGVFGWAIIELVLWLTSK